ncbi:major facilitator superfamily transporter [Histomonas meleagridis]|uniref:major facilitator superfamily transporter n=1 Tax=Histomonas meleagridis TaxID=135588 RepID=UPI00355AA51A|nr:major facilitator superfamily transporter [Histomonas meleagridis]KAH0803088.1 major facilitator superfamily transporter [Histomonas meleagridis]
MNIALNVLQGPARSLVGDTVPTHQQIVGNTIATIMNGLGAIIVNLVGGLDLSKYTKFTNEQLVFIIGMVSVTFAVGVTLFCAQEEKYNGPKSDKSMIVEIYRSFRHAPTEVLRAAACFSLAWCGFFMFLVETTDYFGRSIFHGCPTETSECSYIDYTKGVNFGMLTIASTYTVSLLYGFIQPKIVDLIGAKICFLISQFIEVICLIVFNFIKMKWILFSLFSLLGISFMSFNSIPFAIVAMCVPEKDMGKNMAVVNSCGCIGQQVANVLIGSGVAEVWPNYYNLQIATGAVFAFLSGILAVRLIVPETKQNDT